MSDTRRNSTLKVVDGDHIRGVAEAPATILVYGDYECPYTRALELSLARLRRGDPKAFRSIFRFFPLHDIHPHAQNAAEAAEFVYALRGAEAFWFMHDGLFAHQDQLDQTGLERRAEEAGADPVALRTAIDTHRFAPRVERDVNSGDANGVDGTPTVFINGEPYTGGLDFASLRAAVVGNLDRATPSAH
jgi:protein-disulfide isomerase